MLRRLSDRGDILVHENGVQGIRIATRAELLESIQDTLTPVEDAAVKTIQRGIRRCRLVEGFLLF